MTKARRRSTNPVSRAWWIGLVAIGVALFALVIVAWDAQLPKEHVGAVGALIALVALLAAGAAVLLAWPEYAEWRAEHHRVANFDLWIEIAQDADHPGQRVDAVSHEDRLPDKPTFALQGDGAVIRACIGVRDRFPLRNCVLNIVVPSDCTIEPMGEGGRHRLAPAVASNSRVNPTGPRRALDGRRRRPLSKERLRRSRSALSGGRHEPAVQSHGRILMHSRATVR